MADVKWIKITTDIFDDEKVLLIESLPSADSIITIWFKLLTLAGKQNNNGVFIMSNRMPYTDEMLATIFRRDINTVRLALQTFEKFGMIEVVDNVITIPNWGKHQSLDAYENKKIRDREYQAKRREKQKMIASTVESSDKSSDVASLEEDIDIEEDKDIEEDIEENITVSKDTVCRTDVQRIVNAWNELSVYGIKQISKLTAGTKRHDSLIARIKQYGVEDILKAIEKVKDSDFLQGKSSSWIIKFDWFVLPNNFPKVLEGNYDNKPNTNNEHSERISEVDKWV